MKNLKIIGKTAKLELNSSFYPRDALKKTLKDFFEIFESNIKELNGKFLITLKVKDDEIDIEEAVYGFLNYLIAESKKCIVKV